MNPSARTLARWRRSRGDVDNQQALQAALHRLSTQGAWVAASQRPSPEWERAHEQARNRPLIHARLHAHLVFPRLWEVGPGDAARELERCVMAPVASLLRRLSGYRPDEPSGSSLLDTWKKRPKIGAAAWGRSGAAPTGQTQAERPPK